MKNNTAFHLLIVDDDLSISESIKLILPKNWRLSIVSEPSVPDDAHTFHAAFVDMHLKGNTKVAEGPDIIQKILAQNSKIEVVAMSGDLSMELMEKCLKAGASKFLAKPLMPDEILSCLEKIEALWQIRNVESRGTYQYNWCGSSKASEDIKRKIASFKGETGPILIEGETGTGKEVTFRLLNQQEPNRPTVMVNIAAIPENLFESEMFGHIKGAFTGADTMKIGLTEAAHGGDLFLDEIEALPLSQQVKLLRFIETGEVRKVGAKESTVVKTRVITASNQNLSHLVKEGKFREDLLFRVSGKMLQLPPLRNRKDDIPELAKQFLATQRPRSNKIFSQEAMTALQFHNWPGNVRELKRVCEQLALISPLPIIRAEDVHPLIEGALSRSTQNQDWDLSLGLSALLEEQEASIIKTALEKTKDVEKTAELLKISRSSLYQKIKNYNIQVNP